jgi:Zn ribbon nucleic-acid-binding protein
MVKIEAISPIRPKYMDTVCKHPKVRIVAREDDVEYLECLECGEVFDSEELRDITEAPSGSVDVEEEA